MDVTKPYKLIGSGAMDVTQPREFKGSGAMDVTKPYKFIGSGAMDVTKPYIIHRVWGHGCHQTYKFIGLGGAPVDPPDSIPLAGSGSDQPISMARWRQLPGGQWPPTLG